MVAVHSTMMPLGTQAPAFSLRDVCQDKDVTLEDLKGGHALAVFFICKHCPFVVHIEEELARIGKEYIPQGVRIVAISSNNVETHPDDAPEHLKEQALRLGFNFPYLYDESQEVAKAYTAACTPDFFVFDADLRLAYRGQLDDSRPGNHVPVTGKDIRSALDALVQGTPVPAEQKPSIGCNIKWKPGNAPAYFSA